MNMMRTARKGTDRQAHRRAGRPRFRARRHAARERQGDRRQPRARAGLRGRVHRAQERRHELVVHGAQDLLRRGRRARLPAVSPAHRLDRGRAPRRRAPRQALLPARPHRQEGAHHREGRRSAPRSARRRRPPRAAKPSRSPRSRQGGHSAGAGLGPAPLRYESGRTRCRSGRRAMAKPRTLFDKIWDSHVVHTPGRRHVPPLHRPPSRPRGDQPAGLRGAAPGRPQGAPARRDDRGRRPQRADDRPQQGHRGSGKPHPGRDARARTAAISACPITA